MRKGILKILPALVMVTFFMPGCNQSVLTGTEKEVQPVVKVTKKKESNVLKGSIVGKSNKAKTISITVGKGDKAKTMMVKFNDETKGLEFANKGEAAIISYKVQDNDKIATVIKQKLAKLPEGVTEIQPSDLKSMMDSKEKFILIDSRPEKRFHAGTIPGSISISVPAMKKNGANLLLEDKDIQLVFYCGGVT